jgi:hypothetical protein
MWHPKVGGEKVGESGVRARNGAVLRAGKVFGYLVAAASGARRCGGARGWRRGGGRGGAVGEVFWVKTGVNLAAV